MTDNRISNRTWFFPRESFSTSNGYGRIHVTPEQMATIEAGGNVTISGCRVAIGSIMQNVENEESE